MVRKNTPVNNKSSDLSTIGGRLWAERDRLKVKQVDLCLRTGVSKSTQIKYEAGENFPDARYMSTLDKMGFDVLYILTGTRSIDAMSPTHQNLIEAYEDAPDTLKQAAFAVLLSPYLRDIDMSRRVPGYHRYIIKGEEDVRYEQHCEQEKKAVTDKPQE